MTDSRIPDPENSDKGPVIYTSSGELDTKTYYVNGRKEFSQDYTISLCIWRSIIPKATRINSKLSPLIMKLKIRRYNKKFIDVYSFDEKGKCISHSYVIFENNKRIEEGKEDKNLDILIRNKGDISQMLSRAKIPKQIKKHRKIEDILVDSL
jgi:hypothetical protein